MKMGENTPKPVRMAVCRLADQSPRPTNKKIREWVEDNLGIEISDKTVYNICQQAGLPTSSKTTSSDKQPTDTQMEASGHWPNLRQTARDLSAQLFLPLTQILQFPWFYSLNGNLQLTPLEEGITIGFSIDEKPLFISLKEHLPRHKALALYRDWKSTASNIASDLNDLCGWAEAQPEVSARKWLSEEEIDRGKVGLSHYFSRSLALDSAEGVCSPHQSGSNWDQRPPNSLRKTHVLNWERNASSSFVTIAASRKAGELGDIQALHQELLVRMKSLDLTQAIGKKWLKIQGISVELKKELDIVANLALFPGRCSLCAGG